MKKKWTAIKERRFDKKTEKLQKQAIQYIKENEKLERHIAELQEDHQTKSGEKIRYDLSVASIEGEKGKNKEESVKTFNENF